MRGKLVTVGGDAYPRPEVCSGREVGEGLGLPQGLALDRGEAVVRGKPVTVGGDAYPRPGVCSGREVGEGLRLPQGLASHRDWPPTGVGLAQALPLMPPVNGCLQRRVSLGGRGR